jgi:hypothetical protein
MKIKGILISQSYNRSSIYPTNVSHPKGAGSTFLQNTTNQPLQYNVKAQKRPSPEKSL